MGAKNDCVSAGCEPPPPRRPFSDPLEDANQDYHDTYNRVLLDAEQRLGREFPVIVVTLSEITLSARGGSWGEQYLPSQYHCLKSVCHIAFGVQLTLTANGEGPLSGAATSELERKLSLIDQIAAFLAHRVLGHEVLAAQASVLDHSRRVAEQALVEDGVAGRAIADFSHAIAPELKRCMSYAAKAELDGLHQVVLSLAGETT